MESSRNIGVELVYDWRVFNPKEYLSHAAVHNVGRTFVRDGMKSSFSHYENLPGGAERTYNYHPCLANVNFPSSESGLVVSNFHQPAYIRDTLRKPQTVEKVQKIRSRLLPWGRKPVKVPYIKEVESLVAQTPLTSELVFYKVEKPEKIYVSEMLVELPSQFTQEIPLDLQKMYGVGRTLLAHVFIPESVDIGLRASSLDETVDLIINQAIAGFVGRGNSSHSKLDEFKEWLERMPIRTYDFENGVLLPEPTP